MPDGAPPIVSVIIPAFNAAATIDETLLSVRAQTLRSIEIIVVDDGSRDDTRQRVEAHVQEDCRVRLIASQNGGVARARNMAVSVARSDLIAPVDADDLWHPDKLKLQHEAMVHGDNIGLVYCWFVTIDEQSRIIHYGQRHWDEGNVLQRMSLGNLVGNGSGPLMRKDAIEAAGGYDPSLRDNDAQGCEDLKIYYAIAETYNFAVVPQYLLGYRATQASMSSDGRRMLKSYDLAMASPRTRFPQFAPEFERGRRYLNEWLLGRAVSYGSAVQVRVLFNELWRQSPGDALRTLPANASRLRRRWVQRRPLPLHFCGLWANCRTEPR